MVDIGPLLDHDPITWCIGCDHLRRTSKMSWTVDGHWLCSTCTAPRPARCIHNRRFDSFCRQCREHEMATGERKIMIPTWHVPGESATYFEVTGTD